MSKSDESQAERGRHRQPVVLVSANSAWNLVHFRSALLAALAAEGYWIVAAAPDDGHSSALAERGFSFEPLAMSRSGMNPFADAWLFLRYLRLMRKVRPAVYLGYTIKPNIYGSIAARLAGAERINTVTGLGTSFIDRPRLTRLALSLYRAALRGSLRVFFQNRDDLNLFRRSGTVTEQQSRLVPGSGIDLSKFDVHAQADAAPLTFLFIGRLLRDKGIREYFEAARLLRRERPGARFQILGDLDLANRTAVSSAELDSWIAEGSVEHLGYAKDVRPSIAAATAVVLPSYREGMPRTLLEAGAMGKPLVATDVPGCREIVEEGVTGTLCRARDAQSLAAAMDRVASMSVEQRRALGQAARRRVEERFSEEQVIGAYLEAMRDARVSRK